MTTMRFSMAGVAAREAETGSWLRTVADCLGILDPKGRNLSDESA